MMFMRSKILPIFVISSLLAIGLFGILGISMADYNGQHSCPVSVLSDNCSPSYGPPAEALHHISALQNFAQGLINTNTFSSMLLILLMFALTIFSVFLQKTPSLEIPSSQNYRNIKEFDYSQKKRFLRWLALRHKRDPHASQWVHDYS